MILNGFYEGMGAVLSGEFFGDAAEGLKGAGKEDGDQIVIRSVIVR